MKRLTHSINFFAMVIVMLGCILLCGVSSLNASDQIVMKVAFWGPKHLAFCQSAQLPLDEMVQASKGQLKMEYYYSGSLIPAKDILDGMKEGVADIGGVSPSYMPGKLPLLTVATLPVTGSSFYSTAMAFAELTKMPEIQKELSQWNIRYLSFLQNNSYELFTKQKVTSIAELKGKKLRTIGDQAVIVKQLGAVPVDMVSTEVYTSLERGILDGSLANATFGLDYRFEEPCPYFLRIPFGASTHMMAITNDAWNKIPINLKQLFENNFQKNLEAGADMYEGSGERRLQELAAKGKITITKASAKDIAHLNKLARETVWTNWVEKMNKRGLAGQRVLDKWLELNAKWEKGR